MQEQPWVTVIIPTYNRWPHVCDAVDSVLEQKYPEKTCLVVDDGSSDGTAEKLLEKYGSEVALIRNPNNLEKSRSRNIGVEAAPDGLICFLDSDDLLAPDSLASRTRPFLEDPGFRGVVFGVTRRWKETGEEALRKFGAVNWDGTDPVGTYLRHPGVFSSSSFMLRKDDMLRHGMFSEALTNMEDVELIVRLLMHLPSARCERIVSMTRRVDLSARRNWAKILEQGFQLSQGLAEYERGGKLPRELMDVIREKEYREILSALYRQGWHRAHLSWESIGRALGARSKGKRRMVSRIAVTLGRGTPRE